MKICSSLLVSTLVVLNMGSTQAGLLPVPIEWEQDFYDEAEMFKDIPEKINTSFTRFIFKMGNWYMTGIERGLYNDSELLINSDCFGDQYVTKINQFVYIWTEKPFGPIWSNILPMMSLIYQGYHMITNKCGVNTAINDFSLFCWYRGC